MCDKSSDPSEHDNYIILKPTCVSCKKDIDTPAECDMELFRLGFSVHKEGDCLAELETKLVQRGYPHYPHPGF